MCVGPVIWFVMELLIKYAKDQLVKFKTHERDVALLHQT